MDKSVDIIIPCRNEESYIEKCILSVFNSNYPLELINVFVCDGESDDNTLEIIKNLKHSYTNLHALQNKKRTTPFALNLGIKASSGDVKIILGAHSEVDKNFIKENINSLFKDEGIGCSGGVLENVYENATGQIIGLAMSSSFGVGNAHFRTGNKSGFVDTVAFGAYKKEVFETCGYFDDELVRNQDDEFNFRIIKHGFKIVLNPEIKCKYHVRGSYRKLFNQYFQYGFWKVYVGKKHKAITTVRQLIPALFVLLLFSTTISPIISYKLTILGGLGVTAYLILALFFAIKASSSKAFKILYVFIILHFSYGLGYLKGFLNFILLRKSNPTEAKLTR